MSNLLNQPPYPGAPTHTKVKGYYNPFDFPFQLHMPELNRTITLGAREFITYVIEGTDAKGKPTKNKAKINDPIFDNYVGPNKLAKEEGAEDMLITWLERPVVQPIPTHAFGFAGSDKFKTADDGRVIMPGAIADRQAQQMTSVPASAAAITGYSVAQAIEMGIIKPMEKGMIREEHEATPDTQVPPHSRPQLLPKGTAPVQPSIPRAVPPPFQAPVDDTLKMPKPTAPLLPPPSAPPIVSATVPPALQPAQVSAVPTPEDLGDAGDLLEGANEDGKMTIENTDLTAVARQAAAAAGVVVAVPVLPEPTLPAETPVEPAEPPKHRRSRRGDAPMTVPTT